MSDWWLIFKDDMHRLYEIVGKSDDGTDLTNTIVRLQNKGLRVRCETISTEYTKEDIYEEYRDLSYSLKAGLYQSYLGKLPSSENSDSESEKHD